jgi:hypothetical protein
LKFYAEFFLEELRRTPRGTSVTIVSVPAEVRTECLANRSEATFLVMFRHNISRAASCLHQAVIKTCDTAVLALVIY